MSYIVFVTQVSDYSVWLIVAVTAERYLVVCHPFRAGDMCSTPRARRLVLVLFIAFLSLNIHFIWTVGIVNYGQHGSVCQAANDTYTTLIKVSNVKYWDIRCFDLIIPDYYHYNPIKSAAVSLRQTLKC